MGTSTSEIAHGASHAPVLTIATLACAAMAAAILLWFLIARPRLVPWVKLLLLAGLGVLPIMAATGGNVVGFEHTTSREFCGSCHVMVPYTADAADPNSESLASMHSRNVEFGNESCYVCHSDYGMFGTVATKMAGLRHVWEYATEFHSLSVEEALPKIHLYQPYDNGTCIRCHSTTLPGFADVDDHVGLGPRLNAGEVSCASEGCHGPAHPFSKPKEAR